MLAHFALASSAKCRISASSVIGGTVAPNSGFRDGRRSRCWSRSRSRSLHGGSASAAMRRSSISRPSVTWPSSAPRSVVSNAPVQRVGLELADVVQAGARRDEIGVGTGRWTRWRARSPPPPWCAGAVRRARRDGRRCWPGTSASGGGSPGHRRKGRRAAKPSSRDARSPSSIARQ